MSTMREMILQLLFREDKQAPPEPRSESSAEQLPAAQPAASEKTDLDSPRELVLSRSEPSDGRHCPRCGSQLWRPFCSGVRRGQCGFQQDAAQPVGVSRGDYLAGVYPAKRPVINGPGFMRARARLLGR